LVDQCPVQAKGQRSQVLLSLVVNLFSEV
jgi:hypothetical protein